jgi:mono/diheme cytochrome c family protein
MFVMLFWGMWYFDSHGGWFDPDVYAPFANHKELEVWQPVSAGPNPMVHGEWIYHKKPTCVACHQPDAKGTPGQYPPLVGSEWIKEPEPGRIIRIVLNGLNGPIDVNGKSFNASMVPWKDTLSDEDIADVLTYVRQNKAWGINAPEVKAAQVKAVREKIASRSAPFTADELLKISPKD